MMLRRYHKHRFAQVTPEQVKEVFSELTVDELKARLTEKGIEFPSKAKKVDLIKLLEESE